MCIKSLSFVTQLQFSTAFGCITCGRNLEYLKCKSLKELVKLLIKYEEAEPCISNERHRQSQYALNPQQYHLPSIPVSMREKGLGITHGIEIRVSFPGKNRSEVLQTDHHDPILAIRHVHAVVSRRLRRQARLLGTTDWPANVGCRLSGRHLGPMRC